jgi:hypothetical protein
VKRARALLLAAVLPFAALVSAGCGPWGPQGIFAGGPLAGDVAPTPGDWSFTDAHPLIAIETRGAWFRHSVTILCVAADEKLYVMARHAPTKRWIQNLLVDPRVRLAIGDAIYEGRAVRVDESEQDLGVARAFLRKYVGVAAEHARALGGTPAPGDDRAEVWSFRIDPPEPAS